MRIIIVLIALAACGKESKEARKEQGSNPPADYAEARKTFRTKLVKEGPSPQTYKEGLTPPADALEIPYQSGPLQLRAWISKGDGLSKQPAVLYVHGGSAFDTEDWEMTKPFRDAGFLVMTPILRAENGMPGAYSLFYNEVDDVLAAADELAKQPQVDPKRIYISGHSNGGALTMLSVEASPRFRAGAALSGLTDARGMKGEPPMVPFDHTNKEEGRMRSPIAFAASIKCPLRVYYGADEGYPEVWEDLEKAGRGAGRDVEAIKVPGDHGSMVDAAIPLAIEFFKSHP